MTTAFAAPGATTATAAATTADPTTPAIEIVGMAQPTEAGPAIQPIPAIANRT